MKMAEKSKLNKLLTTNRDPGEAGNWIFSLVPIAVAFTFYIIFILSSNIENKALFIAFGAAAGFIGLESYWVLRGWRNNHGSTVLMGIIGIVATLGLLKLYLFFTA
jgi:uncharacterized membrane protein HdeD (DUF308 family)